MKTQDKNKTKIEAVSKPNGKPLVGCCLNFYKQPFRRAEYGSWVYDDGENFVFQFERRYFPNGDYVDGLIELEDKVIDSLNSKTHQPLPLLRLHINEKDPTEILNSYQPFITIRGWGGLTGIRGHRFSEEKASKIQDDFRDWIIFKLSVSER